MPVENRPTDCPTAANGGRARGVLHELHIGFRADPFAVRDTLSRVLGGLAGLGLAPSVTEALEIALAELLNNVVEHAQAGRPDGRVELCLTADTEALRCTVIDDGRAMPGGTLPVGHDDWDMSAVAALPEGGFGWYLIRQQVEDLQYSRDGDLNTVRFRVPLRWNG